MKGGMNLLCSSAASTAVTSSSRSTKRLHGGTGVRRKKSLQLQVNNDLYGSSISTRYLLSDCDWVSQLHSHHKIPSQVVVILRVSLHCKACAGKLTKHISKMEGVTSFSIDMEAKKVTIIGHVTPLEVLASVSKVKKNAQLWPSPTSLSSSMPMVNVIS